MKTKKAVKKWEREWNRKALQRERVWMKKAERQQKLQSLESDVLNAALALWRAHPKIRGGRFGTITEDFGVFGAACAALEKFETGGEKS